MRELRAHIFEKQPQHWYVEPERCTAQLLSRESFIGSVWDPSCGRGNIVRTCRRMGIDAFGTDLVHRCGRARWFRGTLDFLEPHAMRADNFVMNPPFYEAKGAEEFIRKAVSIAGGKVAAFVELRFLGGGERAKGIFADLPPSRIYMVTPRPSCPPGEYLEAGHKAEGGKGDYVWMVWSKTEPHTGTQWFWLTGDDA